jgi:crotonobetainyl-CoA:carnitine CoA-transferase CaiB-like acyl-CoA transferase
MLGVLTSMVAAEPYEILQRLGIPMRTGQTVPRLAPFGIYETSDGHIALCAPTDAFARGVLLAMGREDLAADPRFATRDARVRNVAVLEELLVPWARALPSAGIVARLAANGVPAAEVRDPNQAVRDPQVLARGETVRLEHPVFGAVEEVYGSGVPIRFSEAGVGFDRPPPRLGEHNDEVYGTLLGYSAERLARLKADGVI